MMCSLGTMPTGRLIGSHAHAACPVHSMVVTRQVAAAARRKAIPTSNNGHNPEDDKKKLAMDDLLATLTGKYGKSALIRLGDQPAEKWECIHSGCLSLDVALGGGYPVGRVIEVYGPESSGKTTLALHAIAEVQKAGGKAVLIDAEHALNRPYTEKLGVVIDDLYLIQPDTGEQALDSCDEMARSGLFQLIVVDSVSALLPRAELEGDVGQQQMAGQARLISGAMRKIIGSASKGKCTVIFINQLRYKVGMIYGNPEVTSGGQALKYYSSVRIDVRKKEVLKNGDTAIGIKVRAKVVKNKVFPPLREATFDLLFASGIDELGGLVDAAEMSGAITRKGAWYYFGERRLGQGRDNAVEYVRADSALQKEVEESTRQTLNTSPELLAATSEEHDDPDPEGEQPADDFDAPL
eukprot:CAMPEP_0119107672 /NCGR_PEP_ID=MMETSP1180-20130426/11534_1 /TAXON_ID=3052 ORGANISM="Chlamydomonas cf sp, Strain CCMP681" /NCGR_SAMPLE_ID=MMETSP1180 /ASSEMBLY_ACC=CAM_ASM_000741 /LENGTH=408 /DNA_ID=CAMNT_0007093191 /DNA_START=29 /DNA_END=1255 /DNA_ORIENTATION=+